MVQLKFVLIFIYNHKFFDLKDCKVFCWDKQQSLIIKTSSHTEFAKRESSSNLTKVLEIKLFQDKIKCNIVVYNMCIEPRLFVDNLGVVVEFWYCSVLLMLTQTPSFTTKLLHFNLFKNSIISHLVKNFGAAPPMWRSPKPLRCCGTLYLRLWPLSFFTYCSSAWNLSGKLIWLLMV